jgi:hypothetical protein
MLASPIVTLVNKQGADAVPIREAEAFFKIDEYIKGELRERKLQRWIAAFEVDPELSSVIKALAKRVMEG